MRTINVAIAFDKNYFAAFSALLESILINGKANSFHFHIIATGIADYQKNQIISYIRAGQNEAEFYTVDQQFVERFVLMGEWTHAVYYRLFFPLFVSDKIDRILYLDSDTIVVGDLMELYLEDIGNCAVGAVYDNYVKQQVRIGITEEGSYFNSGVLLINVNLWRAQKISEKAIAYLKEHPENILFVDQCALNAVLVGGWRRLSERYNLLYSYVPPMLGRGAIKKFVKDKVVLHYTLQRPWNMLCKNRLRLFYYYYLALSPINNQQNIYTDFQWQKVPSWIRIRLTEFYVDHLWLQELWRLRRYLRK